MAATIRLVVLASAFEALTHMFHSCESLLTRAGFGGTSFVAQLETHDCYPSSTSSLIVSSPKSTTPYKYEPTPTDKIHQLIMRSLAKVLRKKIGARRSAAVCKTQCMHSRHLNATAHTFSRTLQDEPLKCSIVSTIYTTDDILYSSLSASMELNISGNVSRLNAK